jgi:hypothetical protein
VVRRLRFGRRLVSRLTESVHAFFRDPRVREVVLWCLPALVIAAGLRVAISAAMPYAYFHDDAPDFLTTPDRLIHEHKWELHEKKTFLVPILFTAPFALPWPALISIPIAQHLMGMGMILIIGALCRWWMLEWKVFILPLTVLAAVNPFFLWYEHTLMAETTFVFCTLLVALAGTLYVEKQSFGRLIFLCAALILESGARPEGKLLFGFGLFLLILVHRRNLRVEWRRLAILAAIALLTHLATKTSQAGLLLYTSVARLTPRELNSAPGFDPYIAPIRADLQRRWEERPQFPRVRDRKAIAEAVERYLKEEAVHAKFKRQKDVNKFCMKLARETCLKNLRHLPGLALTKFRLVVTESPAGRFDEAMLFDKQRSAFADSLQRTLRLSEGLTGVAFKDETELHRWIDTHYGVVPWFNHLTDRWLAVVNAARLPDARYPHPEIPSLPIFYHGIPLYFVVAAIGLVVAMLRIGQLQTFHVAWGLTMLGFFFVIMLTANVRPRFRIVFEPFWFIYIALLLDTMWAVARALVRR